MPVSFVEKTLKLREAEKGSEQSPDVFPSFMKNIVSEQNAQHSAIETGLY